VSLLRNDNPDWSPAVNASGNLVDSTSATSSTAGYTGPVTYVGSSPSLLLTGTLANPTGRLSSVVVHWYADQAGTMPLNEYVFGVAGYTAAMGLLVPCVGPYAQLQVTPQSTGSTWGLNLYQAGATPVVPTSVIRGVISGSPSMSFPVGNTVLPFSTVLPGSVQVSAYFPTTTGNVLIQDLTTGDYLWSSASSSGPSGQYFEDVLLSPNLCAIVFSNAGTAAVSGNWSVTC
jgi:hypothetical protein